MVKNNKLHLLDTETFDSISIQHFNSKLSYEQTVPEPHPSLGTEPFPLVIPYSDGWMVVGVNLTNKSVTELWRLTFDPLEWHQIVSAAPSSQFYDLLYPHSNYVKRHGSATSDGSYVNVYGTL